MPEKLNLADLRQDKEERPGWSTIFGSFCSQAASVCLENQGHSLDSVLQIDGTLLKCKFTLTREVVDDTARRFNSDLQRATEFGAYGLSALAITQLTNLTVIEVSKKGTGFDFWLGEKNNDQLFQRKARLEVSGILSGEKGELKTRTKQKLEQISPTDHILPGFVSIVEFGSPQMRVVQK
jgi:hypothetical protein